MTAAFCPSDAGFLTDSGCGSFARHKLRHAALPPSAARRIGPGIRMWSAFGPRREIQNKALSFVWWYKNVSQHPCMGSTGLDEFGLSP